MQLCKMSVSFKVLYQTIFINQNSVFREQLVIIALTLIVKNFKKMHMQNVN